MAGHKLFPRIIQIAFVLFQRVVRQGDDFRTFLGDFLTALQLIESSVLHRS